MISSVAVKQPIEGLVLSNAERAASITGQSLLVDGGFYKGSA